jgi:hypothetical protein
LPEEFKRGFTLFYVKNINQAYKICFDAEKEIEDGDFSQIEKLGIEVEQFEADETSQVMMDKENILKRNFIEELL